MSMYKKGSIEVITGPMFAGKTTELLRRLSCDLSINKKVLYINHTKDTRGETTGFSTHNPLISQKIHFESKKYSVLPPGTEISEFDSIGIDEAQLFDNLERVIEYADIFKKRVIVAGLVGDVNRNSFGKIYTLLPHCNKFEISEEAKCLDCAKETSDSVPAIFSKLHNQPVIKTDKNLINIGGSETYKAVCRYHHLAK